MNPEMALPYTAIVISLIIDKNEGIITWNFGLQDIAPIAEMVANHKWLPLMCTYGLGFLKGWLWHFEEQQMYEWCEEINQVIRKYE